MADPGPEPEPKRAKIAAAGGGRARKPRQVRKADADESVLDAVELLLRETWLAGRAASEAASVPGAFGWPAGDEQKEAAFCRSPPVAAKLAGGAASDCEFEVHVHDLTERGVGVATRESPGQLGEIAAQGGRPWVFAVPFTLKGETARIRSVRHAWGYTHADLIDIVERSPQRVDAPCRYFGQCSGCQLQHIGYEQQLEFKRRAVEQALARANPLFAALAVAPPSPSPLQLGYRTKLTPHFELRRQVPAEEVPIGFMLSGQRRVLDIEDCIIATDAVRRGLAEARSNTRAKMAEYKRGATLLVRETNVPRGGDLGDLASTPVADLAAEYTLDPKSWVVDVVGDLKFKYPASSFFQNNASILPAFTGYVRDELQRWSAQLTDDNGGSGRALRTLVDAYCGSGLFGIACHAGFDAVLGIEIASESISCAGGNAQLNGADNVEFLLGDASKIFEKTSAAPSSTAVIIDPPRKGSSPDFLDQLVAYGPRVIVYIACGVPAQARDLDYMYRRGAIAVDGCTASTEAPPAAVYRVAAIQPFDLFPQTYHVENIVTLVRES
ncbi:tRNA(m5U54)methyltransferase [Coemansia spiralis]|nr:tRNA(m5U54)methyltransferase [Coemansia spiralis]